MRKACLSTLTATLLLSGCAPAAQDTPLSGQTWQVVALHTSPEVPGALPADAAGKAQLRVSGSSLTATTGCAPLRAKVELTAETLDFEQVEVGDTGECFGGSRYVHNSLTGLFEPGARFDIRMFGEREALLTRAGEELERPSIRMMAL